MILILFLISTLPALLRFQITKDLSTAVEIKVSLTIRSADILSEWADNS